MCSLRPVRMIQLIISIMLSRFSPRNLLWVSDPFPFQGPSESEVMTIVNPFYEFWILFWSNLFANKLEHFPDLFVLNSFDDYVRLDERTTKVISYSSKQDFITFWSKNQNVWVSHLIGQQVISISAKNESKHINCERQVLIDNMKHPFLVSLNYSFQTPDRLYFVLDFINGGELFFHLQRERSFSEKRAK